MTFKVFRIFRSAQNKTRTCTPLRALVPETSVSTDFTIWAFAFRLKRSKYRNFYQLAGSSKMKFSVFVIEMN